MSDLGEALEAIHESARRVRSIRATVRSGDTRWRVWWGGWERVRSERSNRDGTLLTVQNARRWWILEPNGDVHTNAGDERFLVGFGEEFTMLRARRLLRMRLSVVGEADVAGRAARVVRAEPRRADGPEGSCWGNSGEPFEVAIDVERGVVLRHPVMEVEDIAFDETHSEELFAAPGASGRRVQGPPRRPRRLPLEDARALAPFAIQLPALLPERARLLECAMDPDDPPEWIDLLWTIEPGNRFSVRVRQGPAVAREPPQGNASEAHGTAMWTERQGDGSFRSSTVRVDRQGVVAEVTSDLPVDDVVRIARSLVGPP